MPLEEWLPEECVISFEEGVEMSLNIINSGKAFEKLKQFAKEYGTLNKLEGVN